MGERIDFRDGRWVVPDCPTIPFIEGDGTGPDIWRAARRVFDAALAKVSGGKRRVEWLEVLAGEKAFRQAGSWLPEATLETIRQYRVAIKGPLTTPVGGGIRSLNVALRQILDLYACVRPVRYFEGVPSPMREPQKLNVVIFRENIEDVYSGIEYQARSPEADAIIDWRDSDDLHRLHGAEDEYYMKLPEPYHAKNGPFDSVDELLQAQVTGQPPVPGVGEVGGQRPPGGIVAQDPGPGKRVSREQGSAACS